MSAILRSTHILAQVITLVVLSTNTTKVSGQVLEWAGQIEGAYYSPVRGMCMDASGNLWATGSYQGATDFDLGAGIYTMPGLPSEVWLYAAKYDMSGSLVWVGRFGGGTGYFTNNIEADGSGSVYVAGQFKGTGDFDPGPGSFLMSDVDPDILSQTDAFVLKLDTSGSFEWAIQFGDSATDYCRDMILDADGNVILALQVADTADMDPGPGVAILNVPYQTSVVVKLDANGVLLWYKDLGPPGSYPWVSLDTDASGNIWVASYSRIRKFDPMGSVLLDLPLEVITAGLVVDGTGSVYFTGGFEGTVDMDPSPGVSYVTSLGTLDLFCVKLDPFGALLWSVQLGGSGATSGQIIELDPSGSVYLTGYYETTLDLDPGPGTWTAVSAGDPDILVVQLDSTGGFQGAMTLAGLEDQFAYGCLSVGPGEWVLHGSFEGTFDADPGPGVVDLTCTTYPDGFIARYGSLSTDIAEDSGVDHLQIFPNPSGGEVNLLNLPSGTHEIVLLDALGAEQLRITPSSSGPMFRLDLGDHPNGPYWIKVVAQDRVVVTPIILGRP